MTKNNTANKAPCINLRVMHILLLLTSTAFYVRIWQLDRFIAVPENNNKSSD